MTQEMVKGDDKEKVGEEGNGRLRPFLRSLWLILAVGYFDLHPSHCCPLYPASAAGAGGD